MKKILFNIIFSLNSKIMTCSREDPRRKSRREKGVKMRMGERDSAVTDRKNSPIQVEN